MSLRSGFTFRVVTDNEIKYKTKGILRVNNISKRRRPVISDAMIIGSEEWHLELMFQEMNGFQCIVVYLLLNTKTEEAIGADFIGYILDTDYHPIERQWYARPYGRREYSPMPMVFNLSTVLDQKDRYLTNDCLTFGFNIEVYKELSNERKTLCRFDNSFLNKELSDCLLVVKGKDFFASKAILSDRSEVFLQMFTSDMSEKASNEVVIDDINVDVFKEFLRFLYFGDSDQLEDFAEELLYVSDKYMVSELKNICGNLVYVDINPKNAFKILKLMDKYECKELKAKAMDFVKKNIIECLVNDWHKLVDNDVALGGQLGAHMDADCGQNKWSTQISCYTFVPFVTEFKD